MESQDNKIQEMQFLEQNLQSLLFQKQTFQMELSESQAALNEIKDTKEDVFKIIGQLMIKTDSSKVKEELLNKEKILELRMNSINKQESQLTEKLEKLRKEFMKSIK